MKVYSYCSYEGSLCGFVLGSFEFDTKKEYKQSRFILQNENIPSIVQKILECGTVDFAFGNLPDSGVYWIVVKELNAKDSKPYRYLNFAFITKDRQEYLTLLSGMFQGYQDTSTMIQQISEFIVIRKEDSEFGILIDAKAVSNFWKRCEESEYQVPQFFKENERIYLFRKILSDEANKNRSKELEAALQLEKKYVIRHNARNHCHVIFPGRSQMLRSEVFNRISDYGEEKNNKEGRL